jgi:hypothetical protein
MSFLKKSLEKRIQELRVSIEAQKTELAAYEQVLALESGKRVDLSAMTPSPVTVIHHRPVSAPTAAATVKAPVSVEFNGSRSDFVAAAIKSRGSSGITPQEISAAFGARKIAISKNLVYNVLSLMYKQKRVRKSAGRYYHIPPKGGTTVATPAAVAPAPATPRAAETKKRRISPEGMRRIIAATKKRWALQRAAKSKSAKA